MLFPEDKSDFLAPNGITYSWDGTKWVTKTFNVDDSVLEGYATEEWTEDKIADAMLDGTIDLSSYATKKYSDEEDGKLQLQIDELGITKGKVARYTCTSISGGFVSRPGELAFNSGDPASVNQISFGTEDADNVLTKPMAKGDIIEFVDAVDSTVSRYKITDADGAPTAVAVEYISGNNDFNVGEEEQVYIYPQNENGVSKDYVDDALKAKVDRNGDSMTGKLTLNNGSGYDTALEIKAYDGSEPNNRKTTFTVGSDGKLVTESLIKSTRDTGYAFEVKPNDATQISYLHTNGSFSFGGDGVINGNLDITTSTSTGVRVLGTSKSKKMANQLAAQIS